MAEITIKAYSRRGKNGKIVKVRSYSRRVGKKGIHSPKREPQKSGSEYENIVTEKKETINLTPEEIDRRKRTMENFRHAEAERNALGMSREAYSRYKLHNKDKKVTTREEENKSKAPTKKPSGILEKIEDKVAKFVEKYSGKKYKRQL